ncbi:hypothetical protein K435DRAFT_781712 [Dendrothele bispora CBS 962.96]|uniref:Uncharacterized protein n=1 Tax=Dendrothele bispora (strain CBS 962.96) TaxID=1314807 RepID=A0A4S8LJH7_DENBC|nr:hypothetical protein K435DRAFT_781712 [Dendrothele bispora CBS 962.96]
MNVGILSERQEVFQLSISLGIIGTVGLALLCSNSLSPREGFLDQLLPVVAAYMFTYIVVTRREISAAILEAPCSHYIAYLLCFQTGCIIYGLQGSSQLFTAKMMIGSGVSGMLTCVSAVKRTGTMQGVFPSSLCLYQYVITIVISLLPLPSRILSRAFGSESLTNMGTYV